MVGAIVVGAIRCETRTFGIDPPPEDETTDKDDDASKEAFDEIENADGADTHKLEDSPLDAQIREGLV